MEVQVPERGRRADSVRLPADGDLSHAAKAFLDVARKHTKRV
jgi:hypothetical protein